MSTPCAACKLLRRKCTRSCVFAPYFPADKPNKYASVHKVFGASHVATLLKELHPSLREDAMNSLAFEAQARLRDPVHGCSRLIHILQRQLKDLEEKLQIARNELASYSVVPTPEPPPTITYDQQNHHNPMMMSSYGAQIAAQQFRQLREDAARRFASARTHQMQQTPETQTQTQQNAESKSDRDKKI